MGNLPLRGRRGSGPGRRAYRRCSWRPSLIAALAVTALTLAALRRRVACRCFRRRRRGAAWFLLHVAVCLQRGGLAWAAGLDCVAVLGVASHDGSPFRVQG